MLKPPRGIEANNLAFRHFKKDPDLNIGYFMKISITEGREFREKVKFISISFG
jgi:hypothetical protein